MAQHTITTLIDDFDGSEAAETVTFGLDGRSYEIDLTTEHATQLRDSLEMWVSHARLTSAPRGRQGSKPRA